MASHPESRLLSILFCPNVSPCLQSASSVSSETDYGSTQFSGSGTVGVGAGGEDMAEGHCVWDALLF